MECSWWRFEKQEEVDSEGSWVGFESQLCRPSQDVPFSEAGVHGLPWAPSGGLVKQCVLSAFRGASRRPTHSVSSAPPSPAFLAACRACPPAAVRGPSRPAGALWPPPAWTPLPQPVSPTSTMTHSSSWTRSCRTRWNSCSWRGPRASGPLAASPPSTRTKWPRPRRRRGVVACRPCAPYRAPPSPWPPCPPAPRCPPHPHPARLSSLTWLGKPSWATWSLKTPSWVPLSASWASAAARGRGTGWRNPARRASRWAKVESAASQEGGRWGCAQDQVLPPVIIVTVTGNSYCFLPTRSVHGVSMYSFMQ